MKPNMIYVVEIELVKGSGRFSEACRVKTQREMRIKYDYYKNKRGFETRVIKKRA